MPYTKRCPVPFGMMRSRSASVRYVEKSELGSGNERCVVYQVLMYYGSGTVYGIANGQPPDAAAAHAEDANRVHSPDGSTFLREINIIYLL